MTQDTFRDSSPLLGDRPGDLRGAALERSLNDIARELIRERRAERRWRVFFRLVWLALLAVALLFLLLPMGRQSAPGMVHTALVEIRGEIALGSDASADTLNDSLRHAFESPHAKAVVLRINSPGGSPVQSGIVNDEIRRLKAKHSKKVYAVVEEMCASGAYYIAVAADEIYVDKASLVGSIGVLIDSFGFTGAMEKLGVERRLLTAGANKGMLDPFSPQNEQHTAYAKAMIDQIHQQFIKTVRDGRGERLKDEPDLFSGLFWNGEEALRLGLVDQLGSVDSVARDVVKAEEVIDYTRRDNLAERLARRFGASLGESLARSARGPVLR
jgi:protease-4